MVDMLAMYVVKRFCYFFDILYCYILLQLTLLFQNVANRASINIFHCIIRSAIFFKSVMYANYITMIKRRYCLSLFNEFVFEIINKITVRGDVIYLICVFFSTAHIFHEKFFDGNLSV